MKFLFVTNDLSAFLAHRHWLAIRLLDQGHLITLCSGGVDVEHAARIDKRITLVPSRLEPHRLELKSDWALIEQYKMLIRTMRPDIVHALTAKPNLFMSIALLSLERKLEKLPAFVMTFPGLGKIFEPGKGVRKQVRKMLVSRVFKRASTKLNCKATFENARDRAFFIDARVFRPDQCIAMFGAGINLGQFVPQESRPKKRVLLFASRLLHAKGVGEFITAANGVTIGQENIEFWVAGSIDRSNPDCFDIEALEHKGRLGRVQYIGSMGSEQMPQLFNKCEVVCLPTQLQEGFPRVLIEAAANGLALIASDQPSIRQIVHPGQNGWLIDGFDVNSLQRAMQAAIDSPHLVKGYGKNSAELAHALGVDEDMVFEVFQSIYQDCV